MRPPIYLKEWIQLDKFEEEYKTFAVKALDEALVKVCRVKVQHPEKMGDVLLSLAKIYMRKCNQIDDIIV